MRDDPALAKPAMMTLRLPHSVRDQAKILAAKDGVSLNAWIASAVAEKNAAMALIDTIAEAQDTNRKDILQQLQTLGRQDLSIPGDTIR